MSKVCRYRTLIALAVTAGALVVPQAASAAITSVLNGDVTCAEQPDGVRFCGSTSPRSTSKAYDGVPIDVNVAFPPDPGGGATDGDYPLVMLFHGYGGGKLGLGSMQRWLDEGYATFSMTTRGFRESCGSPASKAADPAGCADGYVRLIDNRFEVRDAQEFASELADEDLIDPVRIAAIGGSYGGGMSMALGALKNRMAMPDGSLVPWESPEGKSMRIAAAAPNIPWTDLAYSLAPNGSTLDYVDDAPYYGRIGVQKQGLVTGLYAGGLGAPGFYAPEGSDPSADLTGWRNRLNEGEPYGSDVRSILDELTTNHSSYYIDPSVRPAPMLISSGFTDDLFPVDEAIRYWNRTKGQYPNADLAMVFGDFGHPRAQNKDDVTGALNASIGDWFDHYLKGEGSEPQQGVRAWTQTCPSDAPSGGPYEATNWARIAPGEIRYRSAAKQVIDAGSNSGGAFGTLTNACTSIPDAEIDGAATYELDPAPSDGYTMMGAVSVIADFTLRGRTSQVAARLVDVAPGGTETLVDRGLWRPRNGGPHRQVFQLHPNGWTFEEGHVPRLELMANDGITPDPTGLISYGRASDGQRNVAVSNLQMRMPVVEKPGSLGGLVKAPAPKFVPNGYELASDFAALRSPGPKVDRKMKVRGKRAIAKVSCPRAFVACHDGRLKLTFADIAISAGRGTFDEIAGGKTARVKIRLSRIARLLLGLQPRVGVNAEIRVAELSRARNSNGILYQKKN